MKPLIGITVDVKREPANVRTGGRLTLNWNYAEAVAKAGGVPLLIPPQADAEALAKVLHGWLIPGGLDIDAAEFGEQNHPTVEPIARDRYDGERRILSILTPETPIFGICYGCQFLNVARGGSLIQHLPDVVGHEEDRTGTLQSYEVEPDSLLAAALGTAKAEGKSYHHQAVGRLGTALRVTARNADGTVEALEAEDRPWVVGVQWHPERSPDDAPTQRLFETFIARARAYAEGRP